MIAGRTAYFFAVLAFIGAGWGLTQPLTKTAVSTGHGPFGLLVWQLVFVSLWLGLFNLVRRRPLPRTPRHLGRYLAIALFGTLVPNAVTYAAAAHLPSGILSIMISLVPMFALPLALVAGLERFSLLRILGVVCGAVAIVLLAGPKASLEDPNAALWLLFLALAPFMYALEGTWVAKLGILDLGPVQVLFGASLLGLVIAIPLALATGQWIDPMPPWDRPFQALFLSSVIHAIVYATYVWLVRRAGPVFASQVSYLVTGSGIIWAILLLGESYAPAVWGAMAVMMVGLFLVQPRGEDPLVPAGFASDNGDET